MLTIEWDDELSLKIGKLDDQHKEIFDLLRRLGGAVENNEGKNALDAIFDNLIDYTQAHFETEETLMEEFEYPDYQLHVDEHNLLLEVVQDFRKKLDLKGKPMREADMKFLLDWLEIHILGADKKLGEFLTGKGVE